MRRKIAATFLQLSVALFVFDCVFSRTIYCSQQRLNHPNAQLANVRLGNHCGHRSSQ